jgi:hypothetical protein
MPVVSNPGGNVPVVKSAGGNVPTTIEKGEIRGDTNDPRWVYSFQPDGSVEIMDAPSEYKDRIGHIVKPGMKGYASIATMFPDVKSMKPTPPVAAGVHADPAAPPEVIPDLPVEARAHGADEQITVRGTPRAGATPDAVDETIVVSPKSSPDIFERRRMDAIERNYSPIARREAQRTK